MTQILRQLACGLLLISFVKNVNSAEQDDRLPSQVHFASAKPVSSLALKAEEHNDERLPRWKAQMVIDGHLTDAPWPEHPPTCWTIGEKNYLLHDTYSGTRNTYVWNSTTQALWKLGRCYVVSIDGLETVVFRQQGEMPADADATFTWELLDFHPTTGEHRVLWTVSTANFLFPMVVGHREKGLVVQVANRITQLVPGARPTVKEYDFGRWRVARDGDAVRGPNLLLLRETELQQRFTGKPEPFQCEVGLLQLDEGTIDKIGMAPGGWTSYDAVPDPYIRVQWISDAAAESFPKDAKQRQLWATLGIGPTAYVREDTLRVWQPEAED